MGGPNIADNPRLRLSVDKARAAKMNAEAIDRAIKKAAGEGATGKQMAEILYEGYGPGGVAIVVEVLTDNRNRTAPEIKKLFEYGNGAVGNPGCVAWQFKDKAIFLVENTTEDQVLEALLAADADAEDVAVEDEGAVSIVAEPGQFDRISKALAAAKLVIASAEMTKLPENRVDIPAERVDGIQELLDSLDEHDDVQAVHHNGAF
jgi:YebC/PmpR family DNA-binding regulatory protein